MAATFRQMTDFFRSIGAESIGHSDKTYLAHAIGVYNDLERWGADEDLRVAGMFHSIYGTEKFQKFALPVERRDELRESIGERAERLAYLNCAMDRVAFDRDVLAGVDTCTFHDRLTDALERLSPQDYDDLCTLQVCDWLEQVPRSQDWDYRREAYHAMATRLGGIALSEYDRVFAAAPA